MPEDATGDIAARRARLGEAEAALARLRERYDLLMNRFKFDEAKVVQGEIEAAERERCALSEGLPPPSPEPTPAPFAVAQPRRRRR
jgi:hypothetical protein